MSKTFVKLFTLTLLCISLWSSIPSVYGLSQNEITLSFGWSEDYHFQGDSGSVTISLVSTCGDELEFTWVGIHFAWMQENYFYELDLSSNPQRIPSGGSTTFNPISFSIPSNAPVKWNEYYVFIQCNEHHWYGWTSETWTSSPFLIYIHDAYEKTYDDLLTLVFNAIETAQGANYASPDARSLLSQAANEYNLAGSFANQGKWQDGVSHLNTAQSLLTQAPAKEQAYQEQKRYQEQLILIGCVILAIVIIAIVAIVIGRKKKPMAKV